MDNKKDETPILSIGDKVYIVLMNETIYDATICEVNESIDVNHGNKIYHYYALAKYDNGKTYKFPFHSDSVGKYIFFTNDAAMAKLKSIELNKKKDN